MNDERIQKAEAKEAWRGIKVTREMANEMNRLIGIKKVREISRRFNVSKSTVYYYTMKKRAEINEPWRIKVSREMANEMNRLIGIKKLREISRRFNVSIPTVAYHTTEKRAQLKKEKEKSQLLATHNFHRPRNREPAPTGSATISAGSLYRIMVGKDWMPAWVIAKELGASGMRIAVAVRFGNFSKFIEVKKRRDFEGGNLYRWKDQDKHIENMEKEKEP